MTARRGQVFWADLNYGRKPWLIVSNNQRNGNLDSVIAARITTTGRHADLPTIVALGREDPLIGFVVADDLVQIYHDELLEQNGALAPATMLAVNEALRVALALP